MLFSNKCDYCEEEVKSGYMVILDRNNEDDYEKWEKAHGHKRCLFALQNAYNRFGKKMTQKEAESERFDPVI